MGSLLGHPRSHGLMLLQLVFIARETRGWIEGSREGEKLRNWKPRRCRKLMSFPFWGGGKEEEWELPSIIIIVLISPLDTCAKQTGSLHSSAKAVFCNFLWNVPSRKDITEPQPSPSRGHPFLLLLLLHLPREKLLFLSSLIYRNRIPTSISPEINLLSPATDDVS